VTSVFSVFSVAPSAFSFVAVFVSSWLSRTYSF
jgi:hypothetical protein